MFGFAAGGGEVPGRPIDRARAAFASHRFAEAADAYRQALASAEEPSERRDAGRRLAAIEWRVQGDTAAAERTLTTLAAVPEGSVPAALERARMLAARGDFAAARDVAALARRAASGALQESHAVTAWAAAAIEPEVRRLLAGGRGPATPAGEIAAAEELLAAQVDAAPGELRPAQLLMLAAALREDGAALLRGWESYYLLDLETEQLAAAHHTLATLLPAWPGASAARDQRLQLVTALVASRVFDAAAVVALAPAADGSRVVGEDPVARQAVAYARFLRETERVTDEYYRQTALGRGDHKAWRKELTELTSRLWPDLAWPGKTPAFDRSQVPTALGSRFGTVINMGKTGGYEDLHLGHVVVDVRRRVEQYGCGGELRFLALDAMVSNGFQSWAWDGTAAHGGWGDRGQIVQIRPGYADGPLRAWRLLADPVERARREAEIVAAEAADPARAAAATVVFLPGVAGRLQERAAAALRDELAARGLRGRELQAAFLREDGSAVLAASIFAHEGRHAIDDAIARRLSNEDLEYRAKLSELAFAPRPFLALPSILHPNLGDATPHGRANARVLRSVVDWMGQHAREVPGLDPARSLLLQLGRLSDDQLRAAARAQDPLARTGCK